MGLTYIKSSFLHPVKMKWYDLQIEIIGAWKFFLKQQSALEKQLIKQYYGTKVQAKNCCVIFQCDGHIYHFGLADRLKGICSLYTWCKKRNKQFRINFVTPFHLEKYLQPNKYDWSISSEQVRYDTGSTPRVCLMEPRTCNKADVVGNSRRYLREWMENKLVDCTKQLHVYTNMNYATNKEFSVAFNELFKPALKLQNEIDYHLSQIQGTFISISFRFTTLLGDFKDCTGKPLPMEERKVLIEKCLNVVAEIRKNAPAHKKVLVTADSPTFVDRVKHLSDVYVIPGKVGHIDYQCDDDVNMKTFLDFFMISKAEKVYLARTGNMYNSAFAKTAAMVNNKPFEVYEF
ncbi:hypothetical protein [Bacteroides rodentium]|uniref:hypothetical protein n=1 Tax=Bacteroides rodentium TaxID=691816 RepID=UPI00046F103D|nr:hypothetical protein [Bacteroides rodentium]